MEHDQMLPECKAEFTQISKNQAVHERKLDKVIEKLGEVATNMAVTRQYVNNHTTELTGRVGRQEKWLQRVVLVLIGGGAAGGGGAAIGNLVF